MVEETSRVEIFSPAPIIWELIEGVSVAEESTSTSIVQREVVKISLVEEYLVVV